MKKLKEIPNFKNAADEREFWTNHDSTEFVDWDKAEFVSFPNLKPTMKTISLRLPEFVVNELRIMAQKRDVSYQSLIKMFLKERIDQERKPRELTYS
jgi:predicted DNA binding CopG/RHH family protein